MQPARPAPRAPGGFSPLPVPPTSADASRPRLVRLESSSSDDTAPSLTLNIDKARSAAAAAAAAHIHLQQQQQQQGGSPATPIYASFTSHPNGSSSSLHNFSRPTLSTARSVTGTHSPSDLSQRNAPSPLTLPPTSATSPAPSTFSRHGHARKTSQNAGLFEPILPSTSTSNLSHVGMAQPSPKMGPPPPPRRELSASHIAAQAAVMQHQQAQQQQQAQQHMQQQHQQQLQHARQRSQTLPASGADYEAATTANKRTSGGPLSPPMLSLTEASAPRDHGFGNYHNGLVGNLAATTAANVVFPRSGQTSPGLQSQSSASSVRSMPPPSLAPAVPEKPAKAEKSKVKLFSRPSKISVKTDIKEKPLPSPAKIGHSFSGLQRGNFSTTSLDSTATSFYNQQNSSTATIRAVETPTAEKEVKEKEKKHHFLSRQKNKLKEEFHLPLSSASSNSRPSDPHAPSSLYNFNLAPASPAPNTNSFKSMSGLDLRHGGRALREKRKEERVTDDTASTLNGSEWPGPSSVNSATASLAPSFLSEPFDSAKFGLNNMMLDDAWPLLKAKLLTVFEAEELRLPIEDFNRMVTMHIQYCITRRSPNMIVEDLRDLLTTGFASLDSTLRKTPDDRLIPALVELWTFTFTTVLPYLQAVFLPLDMEFSGTGTLMTPDQARDFWGGIPSSSSTTSDGAPSPVPASSILEVRRLALLTFRDLVIVPRYDTLKTMFSRLSLEFLPQSLASVALASPVPVPSPVFQPFLPPPPQQYSTSPAESSQGSLRTLDHGGDGTTRSRAISNVSFGSDNTNSNNARPYTPSSMHTLNERPHPGPAPAPGSGAGGGSLREQNVEGSKQVTEMVGRMLQCMSVLASVGHVPSPAATAQPEASPPPPPGGGGLLGFHAQGNRMVEELNKLLKLNWLGRGRTGRNRRGIVGGRVKARGGVPPALGGGLGLMGDMGGER